ncbi:MAG: hypothetical protein RBT41_12260 [Clostridia bacterium]|nr:hypothetical protein [Clostridia bacterium]
MLANIYRKAAGIWQNPCRFDVVGALFNEKGELVSLELISNAF